MAGTYKPCPGCGEKRGLRRADSVCSLCSVWIRLGRAAKETTDREVEKKEQRLYRLPSEWPSIYYPADGEGEQDLRQELPAAFLELAQAGLRRAKTEVKPFDGVVQPIPPHGKRVNYFSTDDAGASVWTGSARIVMAISRVDSLVRSAVMDAYETGERSGQNLLKQISSGNVTINELNEKHIESMRGRK